MILASLAAVLCIAIGSGAYYAIASRTPTPELPTEAGATDTVAVSGIVTPAQNPDLAFETGGRVASVRVKVGDAVSKGALLASLDTSSLAAARDQAAANLRAQQAKLDELRAGPRDVDLSQKRTAVEQSKQSLANAYLTASNDLAASYSTILGALHLYIDPLYNDPNGANPSLTFISSDAQTTQASADQRLKVRTEFDAWKKEQGPIDQAAIDAGLASAIAHATTLQTFTNTLTEALGRAVTGSSFNQTSLASAETSVAAFRQAVQSSLTTLRADTQSIANAKLALRSAEDSLAAAEAGATTQQTKAQEASVQAAEANVNAADAALRHALVVAPFSGTVTAVNVKVGDFVASNAVAVSLSPKSALQLSAYLSEVDAARVAAGDTAEITLDAYGASRVFPASVATVNRSPVSEKGVPAYKITLQFSNDDPALSPGMTGNAIIHPSHE